MAIRFLVLQLVMLMAMVTDLAHGKGLKMGYYHKTCPDAEALITRTAAQHISKAPSLAAPLLRMHFHDCFVRGCDGSVLLNSTENNQAEKEGIPNRSLRGFHVVDAAKSALESNCPGVVSCADILALLARDTVVMIGGPFWAVPLGRRDGRVSVVSEVLPNLPPPNANITKLKQMFRVKGLNTKDLAVLSGGHTIGTSHCGPLAKRLYNFTGKGDTDPALDPSYATELKKKCKLGDVSSLVEMDPGSFRSFDEQYYTLVAKKRGLFQSDAALLDDRESRSYVELQSRKDGSTFYSDFGASMVKMGKIGVLTGKDGEIRKHCALVN